MRSVKNSSLSLFFLALLLRYALVRPLLAWRRVSWASARRVFLWPALDLVVVMTGGNYNTQSPSNTLAVKYILPPLDAKQ